MLAGVMIVGAAAVGAPAALAQNPTAGATVYTNTGCGTCHTFAAAGSTGTIGANLDTTNTTYNKAVSTVTNGAASAAGAMPAYAGVLTQTQINDVAAYVADSGVPSTTPTTPTQTTPTQTTPTQTTPTQTTPTQTTPTQTTPAQTTPAQTTPEPAPTGDLPSTGFDIVPVLVLAAALFGLGLALVLWRPRRKDARH
jgi:mono/diheme cytochrome c family protein